MTGPLDVEEGGGPHVQAPPPPPQDVPQEQEPLDQQQEQQPQEAVAPVPVEVEQVPAQEQPPEQQEPVQQEPVQAEQAQHQPPLPVQDAPPQPAAPKASSSWWMGPDWTDAEQEKVRAARGKVLGGIAKLGSGLAGAATTAATYLKADTTQDDDDADDQTKASGWLTFTAATIAMGFTLAGLHDIYDGVLSWQTQIRAHETRLAAEAAQHPQAQQVLDAVHDVEQPLQQLQVVIHDLGAEQQDLEHQQGV
jgi:hypothetical protein